MKAQQEAISIRLISKAVLNNMVEDKGWRATDSIGHARVPGLNTKCGRVMEKTPLAGQL